MQKQFNWDDPINKAYMFENYEKLGARQVASYFGISVDSVHKRAQKWGLNKKQTKIVSISPEAKSILTAGVLGCGSFNGNKSKTSYFFTEQLSIDKIDFATLKFNILKEICTATGFKRIPASTPQGKDLIKITTVSSPNIKPFAEMTVHRAIEEVDELTMSILLASRTWVGSGGAKSLYMSAGKIDDAGEDEVIHFLQMTKQRFGLEATYYKAKREGLEIHFSAACNVRIKELVCRTLGENIDLVKRKLSPLADDGGRTLDRDMNLTDRARSVLISGLVGDGNFKKNGQHNYYYRECHAVNQTDYIKFKYEIMAEYCTSAGLRTLSARNGHQEQLEFCTYTSPDLTKIATMSLREALSQFDELAFCCLLLDDGWLHNEGSGFFCLSGGMMSEEDVRYAINVFKDKFNLEVNYSQHKRGHFEIRFPASENLKIKDLMYRNIGRDLDIIHQKIDPLQESRKKFWSKEDVEFLRNNPDIPLEELSEKLGRTIGAIKFKKGTLGLS